MQNLTAFFFHSQRDQSEFMIKVYAWSTLDFSLFFSSNTDTIFTFVCHYLCLRMHMQSVYLKPHNFPLASD